MVVEQAGQTFETLLVRSALVGVVIAAVWAALVLAAVCVEAVTEGRFRLALALGCPPACHRWLLGLTGAALAATVLAPAGASAAVPADGPAATTAVDGLPLPDRPPGARARAQRPPEVSEVVRVRAGQTLWGISSSRLPTDASPDQTAALTRRLYARNRAVIGDDPDLIHPGQSLTVPPIAHETHLEES